MERNKLDEEIESNNWNNNLDFWHPTYWDERYKQGENNFDWYFDWFGLEEHLLHLLTNNTRILIVGCGNSRLSGQLYGAGYCNITNIDFSSVVIDQMKIMYEKMPMKWLVMDAMKMDFADETFDIIIDKGTFDAILTATDSLAKVTPFYSEMHRVLVPGGRLLQIILDEVIPNNYYTRNIKSWDVTLRNLDNQIPDFNTSKFQFLYLATKKHLSSV